MFVIFSFVNVIWSTLYLEDWKRKSAEKAYHWGTLDREDDLLVEPRPLFHVRCSLKSISCVHKWFCTVVVCHVKRNIARLPLII